MDIKYWYVDGTLRNTDGISSVLPCILERVTPITVIEKWPSVYALGHFL
jgi:hypothetical protein